MPRRPSFDAVIAASAYDVPYVCGRSFLAEYGRYRETPPERVRREERRR